MSRTTRAEQETIIRYAADEVAVSIYTAAAPARRKLERAGYQPSRVATQHAEPVGWFFKVPLGEFRWRVGARKVSAARQHAGRRLAAARLEKTAR